MNQDLKRDSFFKTFLTYSDTAKKRTLKKFLETVYCNMVSLKLTASGKCNKGPVTFKTNSGRWRKGK